MPVTPPVYLDYNATTPCDPRVVEAMLPFFTERFGNAASAQHAFGQTAGAAVERARRQVAALIHADPPDIVFTSGATESNNIALKGVAHFYGGEGGRGRHLIVSAVEHKCVLESAESLEAEGFEVTCLPPDARGVVTPAAVAEALRDETILVSVMWANNEIGTINDLPAIGALCKQRGVMLHTDATQYVGRLPVDVETAGVDLMSFSGHKMYGPKGVGGLYVRRREPRVRLTPLMHGGGHERGLRSGTLNVPGIVGFGHACEIAGEMMAGEAARLTALRDRFEQAFVERIAGARVNGLDAPRLPNTVSICFGDDLDGEMLLCSMPAIAASSGSACSSQSMLSSHVLRRIGLTDEQARACLRFGLGRFTTDAEIDFAIDAITTAVSKLDRSVRTCDL